MNRARPALLVLVLLAAALVAGCQGDLTVKNGPAGDESLRWAPPWNTTPRASQRVHRTTTRPDGSTVQECDECEGGACPVPPAPK